MIKLKTKIVEEREDGCVVKTRYKARNSNEPEHFMAINELVASIMSNDEDMTITKLTKTIKENYNNFLELKEANSNE